MRMSLLFGETLREQPSEAKGRGHGYLLRAAYLRSLPDGSLVDLPLGQRTLLKIISRFRNKMEAINGQEIHIVPDAARRGKEPDSPFNSRLFSLVQKEIHSYRQLPQRLFQIRSQSCKALIDRSNPLGTKPTTIFEGLLLDPDQGSSEESYQLHLELVEDLLEGFSLPITSTTPYANKDEGNCHNALIYSTPSGDVSILECSNCDYSDVIQLARREKIPVTEGAPEPLDKVITPGADTIADLATFLNLPESHTAKAVFSMATFLRHDQTEDRLVLSILRGDMELNEAKLLQAIEAHSLRPATEEEISAAGAVPGYASPIGLDEVLIVIDDLIPHSPNLVAGANEADHHYKNVNSERDYHSDIVADIVQAAAGDPCPICGQTLTQITGLLLGEFVQFPTEISKQQNLSYLDNQGVQKPIHVGLYNVHIRHALVAIAEEHNDDFGLLMPVTIAPYHVHLLRLKDDDGQADNFYESLYNSSVEVLYDDRGERPGVKFNDADLIGVPIRITIGRRSIEAGGAEIKLRHQDAKEIVPLDKLKNYVESLIAQGE